MRSRVPATVASAVGGRRSILIRYADPADGVSLRRLEELAGRALPEADEIQQFLRALTAVAVDESNTTETDAPVNGAQPRVLGWVGPDGTTIESDNLETAGRIGQIWQVAVAPAPDSVTTVSLRIEAKP